MPEGKDDDSTTRGDVDYDAWAETRAEIRQGKGEVRYRLSSIPGTWVSELVLEDYPFPLGSVWFRYCGNVSIEVLHSFTIRAVRRCGVRTTLHEALRSNHPEHCIFTAAASKEARPWLEKQGFVFDGDWILEAAPGD